MDGLSLFVCVGALQLQYDIKQFIFTNYPEIRRKYTSSKFLTQA